MGGRKMTDLKEMIEREISGFLDWPGDNKHIVTTASAKLFAEHVAQLYAESKPATDVSALVEALEVFVENHGYCSYLSNEEKEAEPEVREARELIAAHRKQGG